MDLPLEDGYEYHFVTTDAGGNQKFQYMEYTNCTYLKSDTSLLLESWIIPEASYRRNTLHIRGLELEVSQPLLSEQCDAVIWTKLDYVVSVNGQEVCWKSFLDADLADVAGFGIGETSIDFPDIILETGDEVTLAVEAALSNGLSEAFTVGSWTYQNGQLT